MICADGTWNRPEQDLKKDTPSNVLQLARGIAPIADDGVAQQVFYDWGLGSYHDVISAGISGKGLHKNIMDCYRYLIQNYSLDDEIFLFGFSRGAYTVRCLCGLINNCGILQRTYANRVQQAFNLYQKSGKAYAPQGDKAIAFRQAYAYAPNASQDSRQVAFVGVWDTVGALGIPLSFLGLLEQRDEFSDTKLGDNVTVARHALAIDEPRADFEPTLWLPQQGQNLQQVWFAGSHADVGGGYPLDKNGASAAHIPLQWMINEAQQQGLTVESHVIPVISNTLPKLHRSRRSFYRLREKYSRPIQHGTGTVFIHPSVKLRWDNDSNYRPLNLQVYLDQFGW